MKVFVNVIATILLLLAATLTHATGQYLDEEQVVAPASGVVSATLSDTESGVSSSASIDASSNSQAVPSVNAAEIGNALNASSNITGANELEQEKQAEEIVSMLPKGFGVVVLLIIISTLPSLFGKGVFFWDITDVLVSSVLSLLVAASFIALLVVHLDQTMSDDVRAKANIIVALCVVAAYTINYVKTKIYNSIVLSPLIAFGRLFLPLLILLAVFIARWSGGGYVAYQQQDHESSAEYKTRVNRQEHELSENKKKSSWWIALIALASTWLYSKLIAQKEWKGFAGYFSKAN